MKLTLDIIIEVVKNKGTCKTNIDTCIAIDRMCCQSCTLNRRREDIIMTGSQRRYEAAIQYLEQNYTQEQIFEALL